MNILVGFNGSKAAREALELARKRAKVWGAKIEVVQCMARNRELNYEDIQKVERQLEREVHDQFNSDDITYETHLVISGQQSGEDALGKDLVILSESARSREVGLFLFRDTANAFTPEGWSLFDSAVDWSISNTETVLKSEVQTTDK